MIDESALLYMNYYDSHEVNFTQLAFHNNTLLLAMDRVNNHQISITIFFNFKSILSQSFALGPSNHKHFFLSFYIRLPFIILLISSLPLRQLAIQLHA
jgi:hypothetical protein